MTKHLDDYSEIVRGYFEAMIFTDFEDENEELCYKGFIDIDEEAVTNVATAVDAWAAKPEIKALIERALDGEGGNEDYDLGKVGIDLWYTSNGHGTGFWDRGMGELGEELSEAAREFGEHSPYLGDDGKVYIS